MHTENSLIPFKPYAVLAAFGLALALSPSSARAANIPLLSSATLTAGAQDQVRIVRRDGRIVAHQRRCGVRRKGQHVMQRDGLKKRFEIVVPIGAPPENAKRPVDLGGRQNAHRAGKYGMRRRREEAMRPEDNVLCCPRA